MEFILDITVKLFDKNEERKKITLNFNTKQGKVRPKIDFVWDME
jgi:hypothetical protein